MEIEIIVAGILLLILWFLAAVDAAFSHISDVGLRRITTEDDSGDKTISVRFLREILENRPRFRFALSSAIQVLLIAFTVIATLICAYFVSAWGWLLLCSLSVSLISTVIFRQILPRLTVRNDTEKKLLFLLPAIRPIYAVTSFFVESVTKDKSQAREKIEATFAPNLTDERDDDNNEDFQALMEVGEAEGIIEEKERELIETMVEFTDTRAGEIMTPRTEICAVSIDATVIEARDMIIEEKYSRLPVYRESIDNIEGIIYVRDLLQAWSDGKKDQTVEQVIRDAFFVPETITASELLKRMQLNHVQIAIVIDEYGGVAGLVTVEDIIEEIVGEIEDEDTGYDEIIEIIEGEDGYFDVIGSTEIDKIERLVEMDLEDDEYTTIAGFVTTEAGYVPKIGEKLTLRGLDVEILKADEKKLHLLRLKRSPENRDGDLDESEMA